MKRILSCSVAAMLAVSVTVPAQAQEMSDSDWAKIRAALTSFVADNVCAKVPGCSVVATAAVEGVNKVVEIAVDRHFEAEDQALADRTGVTIRYADGKVIKPKGQQ